MAMKSEHTIAGRINVQVEGEETEERKIEGGTFPLDMAPAKVGVSYGITLNTGNYSSLRCDVYVELPCPPHAVEAYQEKVRELASAELQRFIDKAKR